MGPVKIIVIFSLLQLSFCRIEKCMISQMCQVLFGAFVDV